MRTSLEWLSQYLPGPLDPQAAADALTFGGLPVEVIDRVELDAAHTDTVIDVEVTSNRSDCLSHVGIARELSALLARDFVDVEVSDVSEAQPGSGLSSVRINDPDLCPQYTARVIRNVKVGPSPAWLSRRLQAVGVRTINNVVDITNYVMLELGQPLHAFDLHHIEGGEICIRRAREGEKIVSIDDHERVLTAGMLVIADARKPIALAGVMGGRDTEVSDSTTDVLLESARFDPLSIRSTARALAMSSDSSYRYERGIDPLLAERASLRATQLLVELAGGQVAGELIVAGSTGYQPKTLWLRLPRLRQVLGVDLPTQQIMEALTRLRLSPVLRSERIDVRIPSYRLDLNQEIDLVEEVARVAGYDKVPVRDEINIRLTPPEPTRTTTDTIVTTLVAGRYFEAVTFSFVSDSLSRAFIPSGAAGLPRADARVRKADAQLRPSIVPGLLEAVRRNEAAGTAGVKLFEIGSVFWNDAAGKIQERRRIGLVGGTDYAAVRGVVELLLQRVNANLSVSVIPADHPGFTRGAAGEIHWGDVMIGHIGKIDRAVADLLSLRELPVAAELDLQPLLDRAQRVPQLHPLPRFPAVRRDLSLVVPESSRYQQLNHLIQAVAPADLETVEYVTTYRGKPLETGTKSVTVTLVFRSPTNTLTSEAVEAAVQRVVAAAQENLGATLRV